MNARVYFRFLTVALTILAGVAGASAATPPPGDIAPATKRRSAVDLAQRLATVSAPPPLPPDTVLPFNPVAFGQPDPEEQRAMEQAAANQQALAAASPSGAGGVTRPGAAATDREQLAAIAAKIVPKGTIFSGRDPILIIGSKFVKIGTKFTITYSGVDYVLELTAIDRTNFTLRLNGEEITRPIKTAK